MSESKNPAGGRPAGFKDALSAEDKALLTQKIAEYQTQAAELELANGGPGQIRQRFLDEKAVSLKNRALAVTYYGADRCAGCQFYQPSKQDFATGWCVRTSCRPDRRPTLPASGWCGQHRPILPDQK